MIKSLLNYSFILVGLFITINSQAQVVTPTQALAQYNFNASPVMISGSNNQVNASYRFAGVSNGVDAIVTIVSATGGAGVAIFDDNAISKPEGFSPQIMVPAHSTGQVTFNISFVLAGSSNPGIQDSLIATAIDIDGNANLKEIDIIDMGTGGISSYLMGTPEITVTQSGTGFKGMNVAGNEYSSIDTAAKQVMFTVINRQVSSFTYTCGAMNNSNATVYRQKSIYFKNFVYPTVTTLAVKYSSFDAVASNHSVLLNWSTSLEYNHSHFEVERSFDMNTFKSIGIVLDGNSAGSTGKSYQYKDLAAELNGKNMVYYRLKQFDLDHKVAYSKILAVRLQQETISGMQVSPNPFAENLIVRYEATGNGSAEIRLLNMSGQTMLSKHSTISKGNNSIQLQGLAALAPGVYVARLIVNGIVAEHQKIIKN